MITAEDEKLLKAINAEPVKMFLTAALQAKSKGDAYNYNHIVHQLRIRDDPEMVASVYVGLASCVSLFSNRPDMYRELMQSILTYDWNSEKIVSIAFANLLSHIISSNVTFLLPILSMLVRTFTYSAAAAAAVQSVDATDVLAAEAFKEEKLRRVHNTIQDVISLVPTGTSELFPVLANFFPHKRFSVAVQQEYTVQLLRICRYYPMIQERILDLIISKCLEIDVEIVIEDSGEVKIEEENHGDINDVIFSTDNDANANNQISQRVYNEGSQFIPTEVAEMAEKLDTVLCLLIDFIRKEIEIQDIVDSDGLPLPNNNNNNNNNHNNSNNNNKNEKNKNNINYSQNEKAERLSVQLMRIFEEKILMTHRSKFVQFVLFYFASRIPSFGSKFGTRLVKLFSDESAAHTKRQSAILYLASYSVRANFLNISTISTILSDLLGWAEAYVIKTGTASASSKLLLSRSSSSMTLNGYGNSTLSVNSNGITKVESTETTVDDGLKLISTLPNKRTDDDDDEEDIEVDEFGRKQTVIASAVSRHETFFSCVQAACYIVCFYGVEIANIQKACKITQRKWQIVLTSSLHPLRFCLQSVRVEFVRLAQQIQLLDESCWADMPGDVIPHYNKTLLNKKNVPRNNNNNGGNVNMGAGFNPLDSFFPYDPCLLIQLHQPIEKYYRVWRGVPGLDDINDVDNDLILDESCIIDADSVLDVSMGATLGDFVMGEGDEDEGGGDDGVIGNNTEMKRSRSSSVSSQSDSESDVSHSMSSSMQLCNSQIQSRSQSMDVSMAMSLTESVGIGLLEEREKEKIRAFRGADSRTQSMVSDCSAEEDSHPTPARHVPSARTIPSFSQFSGVPDLPGDGVNNGFDNSTAKDEGGVQMDGSWPIPSRRPRQYSVSSQGSW